MKQPVISLKLHPGKVSIDGKGENKINLPEGCIGVMFCFESKKAAREYWGKNIALVRIERSKNAKV
jgi:hypothetical protein